MINKKMLLSLLIIGVVSVSAGAGTWAYFSDDETSGDNTMAAGTLDLTVDGDDVPVTTMDLSNKAPGDFATVTTDLDNVGSITGELDVVIGVIANTGAVIGSSEYADESGDLGANAKMALYIDIDENGWDVDDVGLNADGTTYTNLDATVLLYDVIDNYTGEFYDAVFSMADGDSSQFAIAWEIPSGVGNAIQGDSLVFDITFILEQPLAD